MRTNRRQGVALVSTAAAVAASALLMAPAAAAAPADPALLDNLSVTEVPTTTNVNGRENWVGYLVNAPSGGTITSVTLAVTFGVPIPGGSLRPATLSELERTNVRLFASDGGVPDFSSSPSRALPYTSHAVGEVTYTGSLTVPAGPFWIGVSTEISNLEGAIEIVSTGTGARGPWTFVACPTPGYEVGTCTGDGHYVDSGSAFAINNPWWPRMAIYGVADGGVANPTPAATNTEYLQQMPLTESSDCTAVDDAEFAWATGLKGGWQPSWAQWANNGRGGPICTRTLVGNGTTWVVE